MRFMNLVVRLSGSLLWGTSTFSIFRGGGPTFHGSKPPCSVQCNATSYIGLLSEGAWLVGKGGL